MTRFAAFDFKPLHAFTAKELMPICALPAGPTQLMAIAYLLRSTLRRRDRKHFDAMSIDDVLELTQDYLRYSREYSEVLIEREFAAQNSRGTAG